MPLRPWKYIFLDDDKPTSVYLPSGHALRIHPDDHWEVQYDGKVVRDGVGKWTAVSTD